MDHPAARFLFNTLAAVALTGASAVGAPTAPSTAPTTAPAVAPTTKKAAPANAPASRPVTRTPDALREALAALLGEARSAADKEGVKTVVVLASLGPSAAGPLPGFMQDALLDAFEDGPAVAPPPASVKAPPSPLNPTTLGRLSWPMKDAAPAAPGVKGQKKEKDVPTVLAAVAAPTRDGTNLALTLLDANQVLWEGSLSLTRQELAALPITPPLNLKVLSYALQHKGEQVGDGECWTLVDEALKSARTTHPDTYVWGRALAPGEAPLPGDIIQFSNVHLEKDGKWVNLGEPRHTSLIERVRKPGVYVLIHQNFGAPGRKVHEFTADLNTKTKGDFVIYRPLPPRGR